MTTTTKWIIGKHECLWCESVRSFLKYLAEVKRFWWLAQIGDSVSHLGKRAQSVTLAHCDNAEVGSRREIDIIMLSQKCAIRFMISFCASLHFMMLKPVSHEKSRMNLKMNSSAGETADDSKCMGVDPVWCDCSPSSSSSEQQLLVSKRISSANSHWLQLKSCKW